MMKQICGEEILEKTSEVWGLDDEGELQGVWKDTGIPGLWVMMGQDESNLFVHRRLLTSSLTGSLQQSRFHSKHVALRELTPWSHRRMLIRLPLEIKAMEEGIFGTRYSR